MGKSKHLERIRDLFEKSLVVNFGSIERIVRFKRKNSKSNYAKLIVHNFLKSGEIKKITKGYYTKYNDNSLIVLCFSAYLGLQSALSFYGLWEQETIPTIITPKKVRMGIRKILNGNVLIRSTKKKFMFGINYLDDGGFCLPYSDLEKTFIDMFLFKQKINKDVLKKFCERINEKKLRKYLKVYDKRLREKVLEAYLGE
ncbi:MAG: hypothetical protein KJ646_05575 [Nanoarchaeota archaeon]|nr:hypothetical protein [Nanoarchaeota archaeon]MBU4116182.1 hypothetical protein [Nanoarchaeota archaeon]